MTRTTRMSPSGSAGVGATLTPTALALVSAGVTPITTARAIRSSTRATARFTTRPTPTPPTATPTRTGTMAIRTGGITTAGVTGTGTARATHSSIARGPAWPLRRQIGREHVRTPV